MTRPSFQFYPGDWRKNANLGRCSKAARGAWIDVLCTLHDSDEYGVARYPLKELANASGCPLALLRELADKGVLKGADRGSECQAYIYVPRSGRKDGAPITLIDTQPGPIWYSSRMVKDDYVSTHRGESTRFGEGRGESPKTTLKVSPTQRQGDGSSSSSSPSGKRKSPPASRAPPAVAVDEPANLSASDLETEGVDAAAARDWLRIRKAKKAPLTPTAWDAVKREALLAGMTPGQAVKRAAESNWQGFKAEWLKRPANGQAVGADPFDGAH